MNSRQKRVLNSIEVGKAYYYREFGGKERFHCVLLAKNPDNFKVQVQELKEDDTLDNPTGEIKEVKLFELYYSFTDDIAILH